jgi:hypothetical protein
MSGHLVSNGDRAGRRPPGVSAGGRREGGGGGPPGDGEGRDGGHWQARCQRGGGEGSISSGAGGRRIP